MTAITNIFQQFDPVRPLKAEEHELYVDWQVGIGSDDIKSRLVNTVVNAGRVPVAQLFTGHPGTGKTTEIQRVKHILENQLGQKYFVSLVEFSEWLEHPEVTSTDIIFAMTRQLVGDLAALGKSFQESRWTAFIGEIKDILSAEVEITDIDVKNPLFQIGLAVKDSRRQEPRCASYLNGNCLRSLIS
jgi:hypothetical protein